MAGQGMESLTGRRIPNLDDGIIAGREYLLPVRRERRGEDILGVPFQNMDKIPFDDIPKFQGFIFRSDDRKPAVRGQTPALPRTIKRCWFNFPSISGYMGDPTTGSLSAPTVS